MMTEGQETSPAASESVVTDESGGMNIARDDTRNSNENDEEDKADMTNLAKKQQQSKKGSGYTSMEPHDQDVLLGRGKPVSTLQGYDGTV
jgi:hypothetical protein